MTHATAKSVPSWMFLVLVAAGLYNILWGAVAVLAPNLLFDAIGADRPRYAELWQCIGMIVGVYGLGYVIAATDPTRHWPIVFVGLLGKIFGPIGFVQALWQGSFPAAFGWTIITNDLIWWVPFFLILRHTYRQYLSTLEVFDMRDNLKTDALKQIKVADGTSIADHSRPVLVIGLRHSGCTFCREALHDFRQVQSQIQDRDWQVVFLHMDEDSAFRQMAREIIGNEHWHTHADPERHMYRALGWQRGKVGQLLGWREWIHAARGLTKGYGVGALRGDGFQLGGMALVQDGDVKRNIALARASQRLPLEDWLGDQESRTASPSSLAESSGAKA